MARSWQETRADKARIDAASGRDMDQARAVAHARTQAYVIGFELSRLRAEAGLSQAEVAERSAHRGQPGGLSEDHSDDCPAPERTRPSTNRLSR